MARPTSLPQWADGAGADVSEPPSSRKALGWVAGLIPPAGHQNWWQKLVFDWLTWLQLAPVRFSSQEEAVAATESGDLCYVGEEPATGIGVDAGETLDTYATAGKAAGTDLVDVAVTGSHVYYLEAGVAGLIRVATRADPETVVFSATRTNAGTGRRIVCDGVYLLLCYGQWLECFSATTGASLWVYDHGADVHDAVLLGTFAYLTGAVGTGTFTTRKLSLAAGAVTTSRNHGATTYALCAAASRLFIAGTATTLPTLTTTLRALNIDDLSDATGECGAADTTGRAWDAVATQALNRSGTLTSDGRQLFIGYREPVSTVEAIDVTTGAVLATGALDTSYSVGAMRCNRLTVDRGWLLAACIDVGPGADRGHVHAFSLRGTFARVWFHRNANGNYLESVCSDGSRIWTALQIAVGENALLTIARGGPPAAFRRMTWGSGADAEWRIPSAFRRGHLLPVEQ